MKLARPCNLLLLLLLPLGQAAAQDAAATTAAATPQAATPPTAASPAAALPDSPAFNLRGGSRPQDLSPPLEEPSMDKDFYDEDYVNDGPDPVQQAQPSGEDNAKGGKTGQADVNPDDIQTMIRLQRKEVEKAATQAEDAAKAVKLAEHGAVVAKHSTAQAIDGAFAVRRKVAGLLGNVLEEVEGVEAIIADSEKNTFEAKAVLKKALEAKQTADQEVFIARIEAKKQLKALGALKDQNSEAVELQANITRSYSKEVDQKQKDSDAAERVYADATADLQTAQAALDTAAELLRCLRAGGVGCVTMQ